jgi:hypothetical protein
MSKKKHISYRGLWWWYKQNYLSKKKFNIEFLSISSQNIIFMFGHYMNWKLNVIMKVKTCEST